ncbi:MAG: hypothetical protein U9N46_06780 [Euryarchaeota archaeon]|nr:hypothetical protein [Euryarchaeota archaeon]
MVSWMYNNTKDVKTAIDNTLRVSAPLRPCVKLKNNNEKDAKTRWRKEQKSLGVFHWNFRLCPAEHAQYGMVGTTRLHSLRNSGAAIFTGFPS